MAELTEAQLLQSIWMALRRIEDNLSLPPAPLELPPITVATPDLAEIVTAVQGLNGTGPTADEIARAIAEVIRPAPASPDGAEALSAVAEALKKLDYRLKGMGTQAYGGGTVSFSDSAIAQLAGAFAITTSSTLVSAVPASLTAVELGDVETSRVAMTVYNDTATGRLFLKFGTGASDASFSNILEPGDYWESSPPRHTGVVTAAWDVADGNALVTEFLP